MKQIKNELAARNHSNAKSGKALLTAIPIRVISVDLWQIIFSSLLPRAYGRETADENCES